MDVFVTGATGTLGRPTVRELTASGIIVHGLARSDRNELLLRELGANPVRLDLFDRRALEIAVKGRDAILHLATQIPPLKDAHRPGAWHENDRLRADATRLLVDAALAGGVSTLIYPSVCFFYPDRGDEWIEAAPPSDPPHLLRSTLAAEAEVARFTEAGGRGIVLRMGAFYSSSAPNTLHTLALARRGLALMVGRADGFLSQIWVEDAARALVAALERAPAGTYDVVDDEPLTRGEIVRLIARAVGRRRLLVPPMFLVRLLAGKEGLFAARSQRVSNRRFKEATGWTPTVKSAREGWARVAESARSVG
ncbi:MAG: NAD(P)-dependent oxidoreductase [Armatimonadota bacterium]|nr:NAD(P)-dependent oxidoreductase [Armatimonadota bacterium]